MKTNEYPELYKKKLSLEYKEKKEEVTSSKKKKNESIAHPIGDESGCLIAYVILFAIAFYIVWLLGCFKKGFFFALLMMVVIVVIIIIAVFILGGIYSRIKEDSEKKSKENKLNELDKEEQDKISRYTLEFNKNVNIAKNKFGCSPIVEELVNDIFEFFCREIDSYNRDNTEKIIRIPLSFRVSNGEIWVKDHTIKFKELRVGDLEGPAEQLALADVLESSIKVKLLEKYKTDNRGTVVSIDSSNEFGLWSVNNQTITKNIIYCASNNNYQPLRNW